MQDMESKIADGDDSLDYSECLEIKFNSDTGFRKRQRKEFLNPHLDMQMDVESMQLRTISKFQLEGIGLLVALASIEMEIENPTVIYDIRT
ncbi:hypothetical protein AV530_016884 [Patagioenas fasciata monilis]|uniref:Uncharacterized protein n=1 Tax=Patagioenas fasciata monilis TaxID=372326 RepID=A0A1V4J555_PATFA|nr:hypothetical protein AV530_016884 [Patagioenas fasciata monilis]